MKSKTKPIPPLVKHADHRTEIRRTHNLHLAGYYCLDCRRWIAWLGYHETIRASDLGLIKE